MDGNARAIPCEKVKKWPGMCRTGTQKQNDKKWIVDTDIKHSSCMYITGHKRFKLTIELHISTSLQPRKICFLSRRLSYHIPTYPSSPLSNTRHSSPALSHDF